MAIQKTKDLECGASGNYWKITNVHMDKQGLTVTWTISLFLDSTHAASRLPALPISKVYSLGSLTHDQTIGNLVALGYTTIVEQSAALIPNLGGSGTHVFDPDLADGTLV